MPSIPWGFGGAALALLILVPGLAGLRLLPAAGRRDAAGTVFVILFAGLLAVNLAAFALAAVGIFSLTALALVSVTIGLSAAVIGRRSGAAPAFHAGGTWRSAAFLGLLALAILLYFRPHAYLMGGWDPGIYVNTGASIATEGGIRYRDGLFAGLGADRSFFTAKFGNRFDGFQLIRARTGLTTPHFYHFLPSVMAVFFRLLGPGGGLWVIPLFGLASVAAFFVLCGLHLRTPAALLAALMLLLNQNQIWFSRFPVPETAAQFFVLSGLVLLTKVLRGAGAAAAVAAALAFEAAALCKVDVLPVIFLLLFLGGLRSWTSPTFPERAFSLVLLATHAIFEPYRLLIAGGYTDRILGNYGLTAVQMEAGLLALAAFLLGGVLIPRGDARRRPALPAIVKRSWRQALAIAVAGFCLYAWFVRPHLPPRVDSRNFIALGWLLTPAGLALSVAGLSLAILKVRGVSWLYLLATMMPPALLSVISWKMESLHFWSTKRYQVATIPLAVLCLGFLADRLWSRRASARTAVTILCLGIAVTPLWNAFAWVRRADYAGYPAFLTRLADEFGAGDIILCRSDRIAVPLHFLYGRETLVFNRDDREGWEAAGRWARRWSGEGRRVCLLSEGDRSSIPAPWEEERAVRLDTSRLERKTSRLPGRREPTHLDYAVYRWRGGS